MRRTMTRRGFVALGASTAVVAGLGVLGISLSPTGKRIDTGPNETPIAPESSLPSTDSGIESDNGALPFGLAVANAAEAGTGAKTFALAPTSRGVMVAVTARGSVCLALNYDVVGEELERVEYSLENVPTITAYYDVGGYVEQPIAQFEECMLSWTRWDINGGFSEMQSFLPTRYVRERSAELDAILRASQEQSEGGTTEFSLDGKEAANAHASSDDATYQVLRIHQTDDFWESDPVLAAYQAYGDQRIRDLERANEEHAAGDASFRISPQPSEELTQAQFAFWQAFSEVYSDRGAFVAWMKPLYVTALRLAAQTLDDITLAVHGTFVDGSTATRRYRLGLVDKYEQVAQNRFDALLEACGLTMDEDGAYYANGSRYGIDEDQLPFFNFVAGLPPDDTDDPRLQAPLFTITDVTTNERSSARHG
ncbi:MAG: hypothetical protein KHZ24_11030 [Coriobacteriia bacterium]|nr:hypothetical protein [Coriobacteriia bacterium]